jgi:hypothetical protein
MTEELGQLASVEVRHLWPHEAADFTPWLAREENMSKLGVALGLELGVCAVGNSTKRKLPAGLRRDARRQGVFRRLTSM